MANGETLWESISRCSEEVKTWPAWMKGGPNYRVVEGEEIAMSNGSKEQELPPLESSSVAPWRRPARFSVEYQDCRDPSAEGTHEWTREQHDGMKKFALRLLDELAQREHQLHKAHSQIATLAAQVEELMDALAHMVSGHEVVRYLYDEKMYDGPFAHKQIKDAVHALITRRKIEPKPLLARAEKAEAELAALRSSYAEEVIAKDKIALELAALREGATWRLIESAPKDRTVFLGRIGNTVYMTQFGQHYVKWPHQEGGPTFRDVWNRIESDSIYVWKPTHWMPIERIIDTTGGEG